MVDKDLKKCSTTYIGTNVVGHGAIVAVVEGKKSGSCTSLEAFQGLEHPSCVLEAKTHVYYRICLTLSWEDRTEGVIMCHNCKACTI